MVDVKRIVEEWQIQDDEEEVAKLKEKAKSWYQNTYASGFRSLEKRLVNRCPQEKYGTILLI